MCTGNQLLGARAGIADQMLCFRAFKRSMTAQEFWAFEDRTMSPVVQRSPCFCVPASVGWLLWRGESVQRGEEWARAVGENSLERAKGSVSRSIPPRAKYMLLVYILWAIGVLPH